MSTKNNLSDGFLVKQEDINSLGVMDATIKAAYLAGFPLSEDEIERAKSIINNQ